MKPSERLHEIFFKLEQESRNSLVLDEDELLCNRDNEDWDLPVLVTFTEVGLDFFLVEMEFCFPRATPIRFSFEDALLIRFLLSSRNIFRALSSTSYKNDLRSLFSSLLSIFLCIFGGLWVFNGSENPYWWHILQWSEGVHGKKNPKGADFEILLE